MSLHFQSAEGVEFRGTSSNIQISPEMSSEEIREAIFPLVTTEEPVRVDGGGGLFAIIPNSGEPGEIPRDILLLGTESPGSDTIDILTARKSLMLDLS
jgi:hypothetical protein